MLFTIFYIVVTCYVYYYFILLGFVKTLLPFLCLISTVSSQGISHGMCLLAFEILLFSSVPASFRVCNFMPSTIIEAI